MLGWKEDGRKTLLLHVRCRESSLKGPEQPLGACLATMHSSKGLEYDKVFIVTLFI